MVSMYVSVQLLPYMKQKKLNLGGNIKAACRQTSEHISINQTCEKYTKGSGKVERFKI
jgi:hypothetical protein